MTTVLGGSFAKTFGGIRKFLEASAGGDELQGWHGAVHRAAMNHAGQL